MLERGQPVWKCEPHHDTRFRVNATVVSSFFAHAHRQHHLGGLSSETNSNGVRIFDLGAPQQTVIQDSVIMCHSTRTLHGIGIVYLGLALIVVLP